MTTALDAMKVFAIRQKSTGFFMPASSKKRGYSRDEPTADCVPRLFLKEVAAKAALRMWLQGEWSYELVEHEAGDYGQELEVRPVEGRNADDMEIVELLVVEPVK